MPRLFPRHGLFQGHSRHGRQTCGRQLSSFPLPHQQHDWSRLWDVVIQYSSRHLYCHAHRGRGAGRNTKTFALEASPLIQTSPMAAQPFSSVGTSKTWTLPAHHARRPLSTSRRAMVPTCAAIREEQIGDTDRPIRTPAAKSAQPSSTDRHQFKNNRRHHSIPDQQVQQRQQKKHRQQQPSQQSQTQSISLWKFPEPTHRRSLPIEAWPSTNKALADFYRSLNKVVASSPPAISHSTFMAGHQLRQSTASTFPTKHESILHHALHLYKTLSNLQHSHDIVLIPARHVRSLFLAVSRQEKTSAHLSHVLRLASDLIWLRSRHHQHQYGSIQDDKISCAKPGEAASPAEDIGTTTSDLTRPEQQDRTQWPLPGLLVSEYTILMDWIGAFPANHETLQQQPWAHPTASNLGNRVPSPSTPSPLSPSRSDSGSHDRKGSLNTLAPSTPSLSSCTSHVTLQTKKGKNDMASSSNKSNHRGPPNLAVDRVWAIWQAFQATGMKPDIVLLTTLMHVLSKAQQFDKADQIWETMMALNQAPPPQEQQQHLRQLQDHTDDPHLRKGLHRLARQHGGGGGSGGPNLETFSVLLQAYVAKNDVDGVAGVYQAIRRQQQQQSQSPRSLSKAADTSATASRLYGPSLRDVNTVLLNQILRLLVNVGEHKAAREIFDEMKESASWPMTGAEKEKKEKRKEEEEEGQMRDEKTRRDRRTGTDKSGDGAMAYTALSDLHQHHDPHHHATFARRAYWRANKMQRVQEWKRRKEQQAHPQKDEEEETLHPAYRAGRTGPDTHTVEIMLQLARKDGDAAFENMLQEWLEMHGHL